MSAPLTRPVIVTLLMAWAWGCGPQSAGTHPPDAGGGGSDGGGTPDAAARDAPVYVPDGYVPRDAWSPLEDATARPDSCAVATCPAPVVDNCGSGEICGDGLDNNCNGMVDEGCACIPGEVQPCFLGPPGRRGVGGCVDGTQRCQGQEEFGEWGQCEGGIWPTAERCDSLDNDCNGCVDDDPMCCETALNCPGPGDLPEAAPYADYVINGAQFYNGAVQTWSWTVVGGPCDQLLQATSGKVSYTLTGQNTSSLKFHPTLSGDYTVTVDMGLASGEHLTCTFIVHVKGPGFRVELCWDTTGQSDIDLHVHKPGTTTPWFTNAATGEPDFSDVNQDDCYYLNCKPYTYSPPPTGVQWGYANTSVDNCEGAPGGPVWTVLNYCHNPRLDIDNISEAGRPENINVDDPNHGDRFRVMVHYYGPTGSGPVTHPLVNVYCGGVLKATYGAAPDTVAGFTQGAGFGKGTMWRVADVSMQVSGGTTTDCDVGPLHPPSQSSGYWVTNNDRTY
jgi:hypothetical protein